MAGASSEDEAWRSRLGGHSSGSNASVPEEEAQPPPTPPPSSNDEALDMASTVTGLTHRQVNKQQRQHGGGRRRRRRRGGGGPAVGGGSTTFQSLHRKTQHNHNHTTSSPSISSQSYNTTIQRILSVFVSYNNPRNLPSFRKLTGHHRKLSSIWLLLYSIIFITVGLNLNSNHI